MSDATHTTPELKRPRWGYQTGLFQPHQPAFWLFMLLMLFTGYLSWIEQKAFIEFTASGWALSWGLLLLYVVPIFFLVYMLDLYEREPWSLMLAAFLWGALGATALSSIGNTGWAIVVYKVGGLEFFQKWMPAIVAPPTEEILKAVGVVFIYLIARREIDDIMDGFVYGALAGLGFAVVEDVFYFIGAFGGTTEGVLTGFYLRVVASGLYGHVLYTGLTGMGIAYFVTRRREKGLGNRLGIAALFFLIAMAGHFVWNSPLLNFFPDLPWEGKDWLIIPLATTVKGFPLLAFGIVMIRLAHRREDRWLGAALASEIGHEGLTEQEMETLRSSSARRRARREARSRGGAAAEALQKKLQREQVNLAMVRTRVDEDDDPDLEKQRAYCASLRDRLQEITRKSEPAAAGSSPRRDETSHQGDASHEDEIAAGEEAPPTERSPD